MEASGVHVGFEDEDGGGPPLQPRPMTPEERARFESKRSQHYQTMAAALRSMPPPSDSDDSKDGAEGTAVANPMEERRPSVCFDEDKGGESGSSQSKKVE